MAYSSLPSTFFGAGYTATAGSHLLSITTSTGTPALASDLTNVEADTTTGDWRKICYSLMQMLYTKYTEVPEGNESNRMTFNRSSSTNDATGIMTRTFTAQFELDIGTPDVADEE